MSRSKALAVFLTVLVLFALPSCGDSTTAPEIIDALLENEIAPPACEKYYSDARIGSSSYLSPQLLSVAYGIPDGFDGIISAAVCLSSAGRPCEFAVFQCKSRAYTEDVALFCRGRIDSLKRNASSSAKFIGMTREDYLRYINNSAVVISGRWVALIISSDTQSALKALHKLI